MALHFCIPLFAWFPHIFLQHLFAQKCTPTCCKLKYFAQLLLIILFLYCYQRINPLLNLCKLYLPGEYAPVIYQRNFVSFYQGRRAQKGVGQQPIYSPCIRACPLTNSSSLLLLQLLEVAEIQKRVTNPKRLCGVNILKIQVMEYLTLGLLYLQILILNLYLSSVCGFNSWSNTQRRLICRSYPLTCTHGLSLVVTAGPLYNDNFACRS